MKNISKILLLGLFISFTSNSLVKPISTLPYEIQEKIVEELFDKADWKSLQSLKKTNVQLRRIIQNLEEPKRQYFINLVKQGEKNLSHAFLYKADPNRADLIWIDLKEACLIGANLSWANLTSTNLIRASLEGTNFTETNLTGAYLIDANLEWANLNKANLTRTFLMQANLTNANMIETNLSGANLTGVMGLTLEQLRSVKPLTKEEKATIKGLSAEQLDAIPTRAE